MNPYAVGLGVVGVGAAFLWVRKANAKTGPETAPSDVAAGAMRQGGEGQMYAPDGSLVAAGEYVEGQRVMAREGYLYGFHYGRGPHSGSDWAISVPIGSGPNGQAWEYGKAGKTYKDGEGRSIWYRFQRSKALRTGDVLYAPAYPQLHAAFTANGGNGLTPGNMGALPDGPTNPTNPRFAEVNTPNVPARAVRSMPGIIAPGVDGPEPLIDSWYTVNYSGFGLTQGTGDGENTYRLFIGSDSVTAGKKIGGRYVHVPFGEFRARLAWKVPGKGRFPSRAQDWRANIPPSVNIISEGVYGAWFNGSTFVPRAQGGQKGCRSGFCAWCVLPGIRRTIYNANVKGAALIAAGVPRGGDVPLKSNFYFPGHAGPPVAWTGAGSYPDCGLYVWIKADQSTGRQGGAGPIQNAASFKAKFFEFPRRRGDQQYLQGVNLLPYPATASRLVSEILARNYIQYFPGV